MDYREKEKRQEREAFEKFGSTSPEVFGGISRRREDGEYVTVAWDKLPAPPIPEHGDTWGNWRLNTDHGFASLDYGDYWVKVDDVLDSDAELLDWIKHLHGKIWGRDPINMGNFIDAMLTIRFSGYMFDGKRVFAKK